MSEVQQNDGSQLLLALYVLILSCSLIALTFLSIIVTLNKKRKFTLCLKPFQSKDCLSQDHEIPPPPPLPRLLSNMIISKEADNNDEPLLANEDKSESNEDEGRCLKSSPQPPQTEWIKEIHQNTLFNKVKQKIDKN